MKVRPDIKFYSAAALQHPKIFEKRKWAESTRILISFCDFILSVDDNYVGESGILRHSEKDKPMHIKSCQELINAFEYVIKATE